MQPSKQDGEKGIPCLFSPQKFLGTQITAIAVDEDALDGVGSLSGIQCGHVRAGEDLLTQMSQPAASQATFSI